MVWRRSNGGPGAGGPSGGERGAGSRWRRWHRRPPPSPRPGYAAVVRFVWHRASRSPHCLRPQPPVHVPDERSGVGGRREPAEVDERRREVTHGRSLPRDQARPRRHQGVHAGPPPPPRLASPPSDRPLAPPSPARPCAAALASSVTALAFFASMLASPRHCLRRHPRRKRLGKRNWESELRLPLPAARSASVSVARRLPPLAAVCSRPRTAAAVLVRRERE